MFNFTDDCLTGIETIDNEHRKLFELINKADALLGDEYRQEYFQEVNDILNELQAYADYHFKHEEEVMVKLRDPELISQRSQHNYFRDKVHEFEFSNIEEPIEQKRLLTDVVNFLAKWLYHHILGSDILIGKLPPLEEWMIKENPCEFTDEYLTGIDLIDDEHRELFNIIFRVDHLTKNLDDISGFDNIMLVIAQLTEYTKKHFHDEEEYMESIGYDGLEAQRRAHDSFVERLENLDIKAVDDNPKEELHSLLEFLLGWLINHILYTDKKIPKK